MIGQTLSHYRILEKLGRGGMGEVYAAEDTKLSRKVALKVLPKDMAESTERRQRFEREAKAIAALNHPNIVTVFSVEEAEGVHFMTMELVRGKTLSELIPGHGLSLNKFFEIATPLTDAVSAAHQEGITHRDLKPDNIMVSDEGRVKVLDFGLAKLKHDVVPASDSSELPTEHMTKEGRILGTVAYMSPEQAEGKTIDHRSDIFSLGTVLFEMTTGEKPFKGDTPASTLSSIIKDMASSVTELKPGTPRDLGKMIKRCLAKDPTRRYQSALDLRNELEELAQEVESGEVLEGAVAIPRRKPSHKTLVLAVSAAVVLSVAASYFLLKPSAEKDVSAPAVQGTFTQVTSEAGEELQPSISPDGNFLIYASQASGNWDIYRRRIAGERVFNLTEGTEADDFQPAFSPDGEKIAFVSDREGGGIFLMGATGESVKRITEAGRNPAWSPDGERIVFATEGFFTPLGRTGKSSQLWTAHIGTGEKNLITEGDAVQPSWSPNGHRIAYWGLREGGQRDIWTVPSEGGEAVAVTDDGAVDWNPVWSPEGSHLYFSSDRGGSMNLWRVPIDEATGEVLGEFEPVTTPSPWISYISLSRNGRRIVYASEVGTGNLQKISFDPSTERVLGQPTPILRGSRRDTEPDPAPDGERLAFRTGGGQEDIFLIAPDGTSLRQLTDDPARDRLPRWSPDGKRIAFYSDRTGLYQVWTINPDGSGLRRLTDEPDIDFLYAVWSPDGSRMACYDVNGVAWVFDPNTPWKDQTPEKLPAMSQDGDWFEPFSWSPDGRWLAGTVRSADGTDVSIGVFSLETHEYERLTDFGSRPSWLGDSRRLVFASQGKIFLLDRETKAYRELFAPEDGDAWAVSISKDDRTLYFSLSRDEADIWLLTLN